MVSNMQTCWQQHNLTHLLIAANGAEPTGYSEELNDSYLREAFNRYQPVARKMGLEVVVVNSNLALLYRERRLLGPDSIITAGFIHALRKLFAVYYFSSTYQPQQFRFNYECGDDMEIFAIPNLEAENLQFYIPGVETDRIGKVRAIADNAIVQNELSVCLNNAEKNCGRCKKCLRTMTELYVLGKLDNFKASFPVDDYKRHLHMRFGEELQSDDERFVREILETARRENFIIPFGVYLWRYMVYFPLYFVKKKLRSFVFLRKYYYKWRLNEKIFGNKFSDEVLHQKQEHWRL